MTVFVVLGASLVILGALGRVRGPVATIGALAFLVPVVVAAVCGPIFYFFDKVGWLEPVPDIDIESPLPKVQEDGPPSARAAFGPAKKFTVRGDKRRYAA